MKKKTNLHPSSPIVHHRIMERIKKMTPEEALAFLTYRDPEVEETDILGYLAQSSVPELSSSKIKRDAA